MARKCSCVDRRSTTTNIVSYPWNEADLPQNPLQYHPTPETEWVRVPEGRLVRWLEPSVFDNCCTLAHTFEFLSSFKPNTTIIQSFGICGAPWNDPL